MLNIFYRKKVNYLKMMWKNKMGQNLRKKIFKNILPVQKSALTLHSLLRTKHNEH